MMLTFHVKYKSGATFTHEHFVRNETMLRYFFHQFMADPSVERVLTGIPWATIAQIDAGE